MNSRISTFVLIGPPGAGKTTTGRLFAESRGLSFLDTDQVIEERTGRTIAEIFVDLGEAKFREIEEQVVLDSLKSERVVVSLGGGSVLSRKVQEELSKRLPARIVVFLDVSISSAAPRVGFNKGRPLLMMNPRSQWQELMNARRPIYLNLADHTIDTTELSPGEVVTQLAMLGSEA